MREGHGKRKRLCQIGVKEGDECVVRDLKILVYKDLRFSGVRGLKLLVYETLSY
jgi:hypothetical protein